MEMFELIPDSFRGQASGRESESLKLKMGLKWDSE